MYVYLNIFGYVYIDMYIDNYIDVDMCLLILLLLLLLPCCCWKKQNVDWSMGLAESVCDVRADSWMSSQRITKHFVTSFGSPAQVACNRQTWLTAKQPSPFTGCAPSAPALPRKKASNQIQNLK